MLEDDYESHEESVNELLAKIRPTLHQAQLVTVLTSLALLQSSAIIQMSGGALDETEVDADTRKDMEQAALEYCDLIISHMARIKMAIGTPDVVTIN